MSRIEDKPDEFESVKIIKATVVAMCRVDEKRGAFHHERAPRPTNREE